jgi:hypothetical protein
MFENERDFRKLVGRMKTNDEPGAAHRERLRSQMLQTFEQARAGSAPAKAYEGTRLDVAANRIRLPFLRLAIAAAILVAATAGVWMWFGPPGGRMTFDRVLLATERAPWLRAAVATKYSDGRVRAEQHWCNFAAREVYILAEDEAVVAYDYGPERMKLTYSPRLKTIEISELPKVGPFGAESAYSLVQAFAVFASKDGVAVEESTAEQEGRTVHDRRRESRGGR